MFLIILRQNYYKATYNTDKVGQTAATHTHTHIKHTNTNSKDAQKHLWSSGQSCSFSGDKHLSSSERN